MTDHDRKVPPPSAASLTLEEIEATLRAVSPQGSDDEEEAASAARRQAVRALRNPPREAAGSDRALLLLIEVMGDDDFRIRKEALEAALCWPDPLVVVERLVEALGEPDNIGRRNAAVEAVTRLQGVAVEPLLRALASLPEHRKVLVDVLGAIGDRRAAPALTAVLGDSDPNVRAAAAEAIGNLSVEEVAPALSQALDDSDQIIVLGALEGLNRHRVALPLARLLPLLDKVALRPAVLNALSRTQDVAALPLLLQGLTDRARGAREAALRGVVRLHDEHPDEQVRTAVVRAVAALPEPTVRSSVRALLEAEPPARAAAALLLGWSGRRDVIRPLVLALGDSHPEVAQAAGRAVAALGGPALESLCELCPELDGRHRAAIYAFFGDIADALLSGALPQAGATTVSRVQALLRDGLADRHGDAARQAARALRGIGGKETLEPLLLRLDSEGPATQEAAESLGQLGRRFPDEVHALISARVTAAAPGATLAGVAEPPSKATPPSAPWLCQVLAVSGTARDLPTLFTLSRASGAAVRAAACEALGQVASRVEREGREGSPEGLWRVLRAALWDEDRAVRGAATTALSRLDAGPAAALLREAAQAARGAERLSDDTRAAAVVALGGVAQRGGGERGEALAALRALAGGEDAVTAVPALLALARVRSPASPAGLDQAGAIDQALLSTALVAKDVTIAVGAAAALGERGGEAALSSLLSSLSDERSEVREAVAAALILHGEREPTVLGRITAAAAARRTSEQDARVRQQLDLLLHLGSARL